MRKKYFVLFILLGVLSQVGAQFSLGTGKKNLQFSGYFLGFYNQRFYDDTDNDHSKDRFNLDFAVFRLQGVTSKRVRYELQLNIPAIFAPETSDEFLMQATTEWRNKKNNLSIQLGYDKIPFSRASLLPQMESAFLQRAEVIRGKTFNRRDMGITISKGFFNKRLNFIGGVYTGKGTASIIGDNDPNGKFMYVGRMEANYPARYRYEEIDVNHTPLPMISVGAGASYAEKDSTTGDVANPILTVDGKKIAYSGDLSACWKGFSAHFEWVTFKIIPDSKGQLLEKPTDYYLAQGVIAQLNYHSHLLRSVFAVRYDEFNPNDLNSTDTKSTVSFAYNYLLDGLNSSIKIHYFKRLKFDNAPKAWADDQIRIGWQVRF